MLGVLRHTVFWAEKHGSFVKVFPHQACGTVRPWSELHTALGSAVHVCVCVSVCSEKFVIYDLDDTHVLVQGHVKEFIATKLQEFHDKNTYVAPSG